MNALFVNSSKLTNRLLRAVMTAVRDDKFNCKMHVTGVYNRNIEKAVKLAVPYGLPAYSDFAPALDRSDVIFVPAGDCIIEDVFARIKEKHMYGKIVCSVGDIENNIDVLRHGRNIYTTLVFPFIYSENINSSPVGINTMIEDFGLLTAELAESLGSAGIPCKLSSRDEIYLARTANRFATVYMGVMADMARHLYKMSGVYDSESMSHVLSQNLYSVIKHENFSDYVNDALCKNSIVDFRKSMRLMANNANHSGYRETLRYMEQQLIRMLPGDPDEKESACAELRRVR